MGVWGTAIFFDDTACDVRDEYRDHVGDGLTGPAATDAILQDWENQVDEQEMGVVWLALAATQWKCDRLEERVKQQALRIIDSNSDLERWEDDQKLIKKRKVALEKLKQQLLAAQPGVRKIPKRFRESCDWKVGELIGYKLRSDKWANFHVCGFDTDRGGTWPRVHIVQHVFESNPCINDLRNYTDYVIDLNSKNRDEPFCLGIGRVKEKELPADRVVRIGMGPGPHHQRTVRIEIEGRRRDVVKGGTFTLWRYLDSVLEKNAGMH